MTSSKQRRVYLPDWPSRVLATLAGFIFATSAVLAQTSSNSSLSDQLGVFNSLDSSQQQTILQAIGQMGGSGSRGLSGQNQSSDDMNGGRNGAFDIRGRNDRNRSRINGQQEPVIPVLKGEDTVLIDIGFPQSIMAPQQQAAVTEGTRMPGSSSVAGQSATPPVPAQQNVQPVTASAADSDVPLTEQERQSLRDLINLVRSKNPYQLTRDGALVLPGFAPIPLAGLTVQEATTRIAAEPAFVRLQIKLTLLPLEKSGPEGLKPFGYDLFDQPPSTFAPVTDVPVPADYIVGPGDELQVQLYGNQNRTQRLMVGRDGRINFPQLGPINVGGQTFNAVKTDIESRVERQIIGVHASVAMGDTRAIRVFVLGEAMQPGSYTVSGLSTITTALFVSGGVKPIGSLRKIQLKRRGAIVGTLDLYDLLLKGDTSGDNRLLPGDVIFIPPVGATAAVNGEVRRPAIYELKGGESTTELIALAGSLTPEADLSKTSLTRINEQGERVALSVSINIAARAEKLRSGDALYIARIRPTLESGITIDGHVFAKRTVAWQDGLRLSDVIRSIDDLKPNADIHYLLVRRELPPDRRVAVLSADLAKALQNPGSADDVALMARDRITVFDFETDRSRIIKPIMDELRLQSRADRPTEVVNVGGRIKVPGEYPLEPNMRVSDLLRAGGNLQDAAYVSSAELTRYVEREGRRTTQLIQVDLAAIARGDTAADLPLQSSDLLTIKELPQWSDQEKVTLKGEVRFPGVYSIQRGETLHSVITRAGGLSDLAFQQGSVFTREDLKEREQQQLDLLSTRMQSDLASLALQGAQVNQGQATQALSVGQSILAQLKATKAVGRLVIDLNQVMASAPGSENDILLRGGDTLVVPKLRQEVTVIGEVQTTTSHLYRKDLSRDDYVRQSGGVTRKADEKQTYVVRANGSVVAGGSRWFDSGGNVRMQPGDTVVVPLDTERMPALPLWQAVTQIVYNLAIAAAAVNSF